MSSIDQLKALIARKGGVAQSNMFVVELPSAFGFADPRDLNLLCRTAQLPGRQILTQERRYGPKATKTAYAHEHDEVAMTFMILNDYGTRRYFENWQNAVFNQGTNNVAYKSEYAQDIVIKQLKKGIALDAGLEFGNLKVDVDFYQPEDVVYEVKLINAFPTTLNEVAMSNEQSGILELNVNFTFDKWKSASFFGEYSRAGQAIRSASQINRINNILNR